MYLGGLMARLDQDDGWCGVFWQRDPDGMRACLDGWEVPPWDVVEALLQDLGAERGNAAAQQEAARARALHTAALAAYDARPGGREALGDRLDVMLREQRYAVERQAELARLLPVAATPDEADAIRVDLAWARDDQDRATARCDELRSRMAEFDRRELWGPALDPSVPPPADTSGAPVASEVPESPVHPRRQRPQRRPRGARFAGVEDDGGAAVAVPQLPGTEAPVAVDSPRGARFGPAVRPSRTQVRRPDEGAPRPDGDARRAVADTVADLVRLRGEGRTGEAHGLLVEAVYWPAARFPLLAAELRDAGLGADWATLLWEAASLPADRLVAAADALIAAGRTVDGVQVLRQGVARPAREIGDGVVGLLDEGREREARALLDAYVRVRTPEEAARSAHSDPHRLIPLLLEAATTISEERHWDLVHALRVAGLHA